MSKIVCRVTPVNGYDIPGLERWLEKQAAKGLIFAMTVGVFPPLPPGTRPRQARPDRPGAERPL